MPKILQNLSDTQNVEWQLRVQYLKRIQELAPALQQWLPKMLNPLKAQVADLRSVSAKEAGTTIQILASCLDFEPTAFKLLPSLVKLVHSGHKILAEIGHTTILGILNFVNSVRIHQQLQQEISQSKAQQVHHKISIYLYFILSN